MTDVQAFGAVPDAVKLIDGSCSGTSASSPSGNFTIADIGKAVKITDGYTNAGRFRGTITAVPNSTTLTLSGSVSTSSTGTAQIIYGTDNATALNAAFAAAEALLTSYDEKIEVVGQSSPTGGGYLFSSVLASNNININFEAWLYSNIGLGSGDTTIPWDLGNSHITNLKMDVSGGRGPRWGNTGGHRLRNYWCEIKNVGFNSQTGLSARGYGFNIMGNITIDHGSTGIDWTSCQDIYGPGEMIAVGCNNPFIFSGCEDFQVRLVADTTSSNCGKVDACRNGTLDITTFTNFEDTTTCTLKIGSVSTTPSRGLKINLLAQATGGKAVFVDYCDGGVSINVTCTNKPLFSNAVVAITHAVEYGTHNSGTLDIHVARDSDIALSSGTVYGNLTDNCNGVTSFSQHVVCKTVEVNDSNVPPFGIYKKSSVQTAITSGSHTVLACEGVTSAVNYVRIINSATGGGGAGAVAIQAVGSDTDVILNLQGQGAGWAQIQPQGASGIGLILKGQSAQTGDLLKIRDSSNSDLATISANGTINTTQVYKVSGTQVLGARKTGWGAPTGTATRSAFATSTVTTAQLAERLKALIDDLTSTGTIGA